MTKRKIYHRKEYKGHPGHTFLNLAGYKVEDEEYHHYPVGARRHVHIACGEGDMDQRFVHVDSLMTIAKTVQFGVESAPRIKKVDVSFNIGKNACTIGVTDSGSRIFLCEGKTGSFFAPIP